jgi:hypothetical protein
MQLNYPALFHAEFGGGRRVWPLFSFVTPYHHHCHTHNFVYGKRALKHVVYVKVTSVSKVLMRVVQ